MLPQNKISGLSIAWGRGRWDEVEDGKQGYVFLHDHDFRYEMTPDFMMKNDITDEALFDCLEQIEDELGSPGEHRDGLGLFPKAGLTHPGIVVRSRMNPAIICSFAPMSAAGDIDGGFFQWYLDKADTEVAGLVSYMHKFDMMAGNREANIVVSPIVPSYQEASLKTANIMEDDRRERFLNMVWNYHKNVAHGFKKRLGEEILNIWKDVAKTA